MKKLMVVFAFLIASLSPGFAQNQIDAATRQDVADLMELTGARERIPNIDSAMAGQFAAGFAARHQQRHPNANPAEVQKAATEAAERFPTAVESNPQRGVARRHDPGLSEILHPLRHQGHQRVLWNAAGQKRLKNTNAMMIDAIEAAQAVMNKHMPEIEAQIEKTAADASQPALTQPK